MIQHTSIPKKEQENVLGAFWFMLREAEEQAYESKDPIARHFVESHYMIWNRVTGSDIKPRWPCNLF
jgi:hypothetical protein